MKAQERRMTHATPVHPLPLRPQPSAISLRESLVRLNVCRERDFRRCRGRVRRLARGLPAFDFVWIDALLHAGVLTPFQAKVLESSPPDELRVGPCVLLDRLGRGETSETFLATTPGGLDKVVLKRIRLGAEVSGPACDRVRSLIERLSGLDHPFVVGPHFVDHHGNDLIMLSRHAAGPTCRELLIRRGRFPVDVVAQIARQLAAGLAALESRACLHGQIQLPNVRLTSTGQAILVDAGIGQALERGLFLRGNVPPELYEGTAPELIGTGNSKTTATEMYAFGCLLWQLLAGRPPFPTADPLGKLAAHQSRPVPEIGEFAPDTPAPLAEAIRALTQRDPSRRPATFAEVTVRFGSVENTTNRRLAQFRRQFDTAAPLERMPVERESRLSLTGVATIAILLAGAALALSDASVSNRLQWLRSSGAAIWTRVAARASAPETITVHANDPGLNRYRPLPTPDAEGRIVLNTGVYEATSLSHVGDLSIRGSGQSAAVIVVRDQPFKIVCRRFAMENVVVRRDESSANSDTITVLVALRSQDVQLERCAFLAEKPAKNRAQPVGRDKDADGEGAAVVWTGLEARDPDAGRIRLSNSVFFNAGTAVVCDSAPSRLEVDNCLKVGGSLFELRNWPAVRDLALSARHLTLRRAQALCSAQIPKVTHRKAQLRAALDECVFDLTGPQAGLLRLTNNGSNRRRDPPFIVTGDGSVIQPGVPIVAWTGAGATARPAAESSKAVVEGLAVGEFQFTGPPSMKTLDSAVEGRSLQIPRRSDVPPGIVAGRLAQVGRETSVEARAEPKHGTQPVSN
jgi:eukaryotic-like serine/threonine-protein kinase